MKIINDTEIAKMLLSIGAISINVQDPFTYSSGVRSPIYCDNRLLISYPKRRRMVRDALINSIIDLDSVDCIAGTATAGIPHAAWIAEALQKPMIYVRSSSKGHGRGNRIEGLLEPEQRVVLIEDLITTGGSAFAAAEAITSMDGIVQQVASIFTYNFSVTQEKVNSYPMPITSICDFDVLVAVALKECIITAEEEVMLRQWQQDPESDAWMSV